MAKPTFYITTPIYYPSDKLHIGHSYTTVICDAIARYKRMQGYDVLYLTGTDEHGQKIQDKAAAKGVTPKEYVDEIVAGIKELWKLMNISNDRFVRTTDDYHVETVQKIFKTLYDKGDIYKGSYKGHYCKPCESFWTQSQLNDGKCPDCGGPVYEAEEEAYFFRTGKYAQRLLHLYETHPDFIQPETRKNEMIAFISQGLQDTCVSRTSVSWGIPVTFDPAHTVYVWVDALSNYISALGYGNEAYSDYEKYWPADIHVVGKEILRFHTIIWPAMLMALDLPLPKRVFGHGWVLLDGGKMSKSKGNVVDPVVLCGRYGTDAIRYFLLREIPFGNDGIFSNETLLNRINTDLANDLGNLLSRSVAMVEKYFGGTLPAKRESGEFDDELIATVQNMPAAVTKCMDDLLVPQALQEIFKGIQRANKYIDETLPWALAKDEAKRPRLAGVLYNLCETLRYAAVLLQPFMPDTAPEIAKQVGFSPEGMSYDSLAKFGGLGRDGEEITVHKGEALFPRIDVAKELSELAAVQSSAAGHGACADAAANSGANAAASSLDSAPAEKAAPQEHLPEITIDDFSKCELRVARVLACERLKESKKLLKFCLFDGERERTILSGIAKWYAPEDLLGKQVAIVANLAPRPMMSGKYVSEGMILSAADSEGNVSVVLLPDSVKPGSTLG
ncbi:MAG: methionine--tRNA ligase [Ruthenibacterium sp.]